MVIDLELTELPGSMTGLEAFDLVRCLVRFQSTPIAWWEFNVVDGAVDLRCEVHGRMSSLTYPITSELLQDHLRGDTPAEGSVHSLFEGAGAGEHCACPMTVAVCTRNRADDLRSCLASLRALHASGVEVLVVDNAPDDQSTAKLVTTEFPEFKYILEKRPGLDWARNRAWREARHDVIAYTDDDVVVDVGWARAVAAVFAECEEVAALTGLVVPFELETRSQRHFENYGGFGRGLKRRWISVMPDDPNSARPWGTGQFGTGANMAFRKSILEQLGGFDPALDVGTETNGGGDLEMLFRVLRSGNTLVYEPRAIVRHVHRRNYADLIQQIQNNGVGLVSFFQRTAIAFPSERRRLLQVAKWLWIHWYFKRLIQSFGSGNEFPRRLIVAEMRGFLKGFGRYRKSCRTAIELGGEQGIADSKIAPDGVEVTGIPVAQSPLVVCRINIANALPMSLETGNARRARVFVFADEKYVGRFDINNHGRQISRLELIDHLTMQFGLRLMDTDRLLDRETLWVQGSQATAAFLGLDQGNSYNNVDELPANVSVSIVVATRDRPDELRRCLEALTNLDSHRPIEILVVDNNPESALTSATAKLFEGVRLLTQTVPGLSYARNTGIVAATGEIIVCVDDDVVVPPSWLEKLLKPFASSNVAAVTGNVLPLTLNSRAAVLFETYGGLGRGNRYFIVDKKWMSTFKGQAVPTWNLGATANAAFRADVFRSQKIGLFDEVLGAGSPTGCSEDTLVFYNILAAGKKIVYEPNAWVWHEHRDSMPALRKQLYNYSKGHMAYHLLVSWKHRDLRSIKRIALTLPLWRLRQILRHMKRRLRGGEPEFPLSLVLVEIAGHFVGPFSLFRSFLRVRRYGRIRHQATGGASPALKKPEQESA